MSSDKTRTPNYSGYDMTDVNINPNCLDEDGEETTRRIAFQPSFEPVMNCVPFNDTNLGLLQTNISKSQTPEVSLAVRTKGIWKLSAVPPLPEFHLIEGTAVFVPHSTATDVSMRVSNVLRERSIDAVYDDGLAKVKCITGDGVDFRIRLYQGREMFSHGFIVEVQRRFGNSNSFHADVKAILDAAEGKPTSQPLVGSSLPLVPESDDCYQPNGLSSLSFVSKMLNHEGYDSYYLGFQTLVALTDVGKIGPATASAVAKELLTSEENDVGVKVLSLILEPNSEDELYKLRSIAMTVLANSMQAIDGDIHQSLRDQLRPILIIELRNAATSPRNAYQAARAIQFLISKDQNVADIHAALKVAHEVGSLRHLSLEQETRHCLDAIQ